MVVELPVMEAEEELEPDPLPLLAPDPDPLPLPEPLPLPDPTGGRMIGGSLIGTFGGACRIGAFGWAAITAWTSGTIAERANAADVGVSVVA